MAVDYSKLVFDAALERARETTEWSLDAIAAAIGRCGSEIERGFLYAVLAVSISRYSWVQVLTEGGVWVDFLAEDKFHRVRITPQWVNGRNRHDFLIEGGDYVGDDAAGSPTYVNTRVVVECDGHEFHEKTKEQARKDKRRDREAVHAGTVVLRFAGSEIYADPLKCATECLRLLDRRTLAQGVA